MPGSERRVCASRGIRLARRRALGKRHPPALRAGSGHPPLWPCRADGAARWPRRQSLPHIARRRSRHCPAALPFGTASGAGRAGPGSGPSRAPADTSQARATVPEWPGPPAGFTARGSSTLYAEPGGRQLRTGRRLGRAHDPGRCRPRVLSPAQHRRWRRRWLDQRRQQASRCGAGRCRSSRPPPQQRVRLHRPVRRHQRRCRAVASSTQTFCLPVLVRHSWDRPGRREAFFRAWAGPAWFARGTSGRWDHAYMVCLVWSERYSTRFSRSGGGGLGPAMILA